MASLIPSPSQHLLSAHLSQLQTILVWPIGSKPTWVAREVAHPLLSLVNLD